MKLLVYSHNHNVVIVPYNSTIKHTDQKTVIQIVDLGTYGICVFVSQTIHVDDSKN